MVDVVFLMGFEKLVRAVDNDSVKAFESIDFLTSHIRLLPLSGMYEALEALGADSCLLDIAGTWGEGEEWSDDDDAETLKLLRGWISDAEPKAEATH